MWKQTAPKAGHTTLIGVRIQVKP